MSNFENLQNLLPFDLGTEVFRKNQSIKTNPYKYYSEEYEKFREGYINQKA